MDWFCYHNHSSGVTSNNGTSLSWVNGHAFILAQNIDKSLSTRGVSATPRLKSEAFCQQCERKHNPIDFLLDGQPRITGLRRDAPGILLRYLSSSLFAWHHGRRHFRWVTVQARVWSLKVLQHSPTTSRPTSYTAFQGATTWRFSSATCCWFSVKFCYRVYLLAIWEHSTVLTALILVDARPT